MNRFITAVTVPKFMGEASTKASARSKLVQQRAHIIGDGALAPVRARGLHARAAVAAELDLLVDEVDFLRLGPRFRGRGENLIDGRIDDPALSITADDGDDFHAVLCSATNKRRRDVPASDI